MWGVLQGLLRGRVLYTPDNPVVREIIAKANKTLEVFGEFRENSQTLGNVYMHLKHLDEYEGAAAILTTLFFSEFYNETRKREKHRKRIDEREARIKETIKAEELGYNEKTLD